MIKFTVNDMQQVPEHFEVRGSQDVDTSQPLVYALESVGNIIRPEWEGGSERRCDFFLFTSW